MDDVVIKISTNSCFSEFIKFSDVLYRTPIAQVYKIELNNVSRLGPFEILYSFFSLRQFVSKIKSRHKPKIIFNISGKEYSYKEALKLFVFDRIDKNNTTYMPLYTVIIQDLYNEAWSYKQKVEDIIEYRSKIFAKQIALGEDGFLVNYMTYAIRELVRNCVYYCCSNKIYLSAQHCKENDFSELVVFDEGIGIPKSLGKYSKWNFAITEQALEASLHPGVTGAYRGNHLSVNNIWDPSGFGLFNLASICQKNNGRFIILSNNRGIMLSSESIRYFKVNFTGTAVYLKFQNSKLNNLMRELHIINDLGINIVGKNSKIADISFPSMSIQTLTQNIQQLYA